MLRIIVLTLVLFASRVAFSYNVQPMVTEFKPSGPDATRIFYVENTYDEKLAVQVSTYTRAINEKGEELREETKNFVVYPDQLVINGKEKRSVRVTYVGPRDIKIQMPYRISFDQLPVDLKKKSQIQGAQVKFMFNYVTAVYISPDGVESKVEIESQKKDGDKLKVNFVNNGTAYELLSHFTIKLIGDGKEESITAEDQKLTDGVNLLPKSNRRIEFHLPEKIKGATKVELRLTPKKI